MIRQAPCYDCPVRPLLLFLLAACRPADDSGGTAELPPNDTEALDSSTPGFTADTGVDPGTYDETPAHTLALQHAGFWILTPLGGPYKALTGELEISEILDGDTENPACALRYALTGTAEIENCPGCSFTFLVSHYLVEGDPSGCREPELPSEQERQGFATPTVYQDYAQTGLWLSWYTGTFANDELDFSWESTVGVDLPEENP